MHIRHPKQHVSKQSRSNIQQIHKHRHRHRHTLTHTHTHTHTHNTKLVSALSLRHTHKQALRSWGARTNLHTHNIHMPPAPVPPLPFPNLLISSYFSLSVSLFQSVSLTTDLKYKL